MFEKITFEYIFISTKDCGSPGALTNGRVDAVGTQYLDSANYTCNSGYVVNGTETEFLSRVCQDDGTWSGELPTCFYIGMCV